MKYQYNFAFLEEWKKANPQIKDKVLCKALGVKANSGFMKWIERKRQMPVISLQRFCNSFNVPLSAFIRDADADRYKTIILRPSANDQLEPEGGYLKLEQRRQRGEHTLFDPLDVTVTASVVPESIVNDKKNVDDSEKEDKLGTHILDTDKCEHINISTLVMLEMEHKKQIGRLLDIISKQQKQIEDLTMSHK